MIWTRKYFGTFDDLRISLLFGRNYAELLWQSGALGHVLYLAAEAAGFGATGHCDGIKRDGAVNHQLSRRNLQGINEFAVTSPFQIYKKNVQKHVTLILVIIL